MSTTKNGKGPRNGLPPIAKQSLAVRGQGDSLREAREAQQSEVEDAALDIRLKLARDGRGHFTDFVLRGLDPEARFNGVSRSERATAAALYHKSVLDTQRREELFKAFLDGLGFASEAQARAAAEMQARMGSVSIEQAERDAVKLLKGLMAANHEKREELRRQLFGEIAVHVNGTNGNGKH